MPKRVCLYARVSTSSQSVERQISELEIVAARNDWEIVDRYIDLGISGATGRDQRYELDRMMKDCERRSKNRPRKRRGCPVSGRSKTQPPVAFRPALGWKAGGCIPWICIGACDLHAIWRI